MRPYLDVIAVQRRVNPREVKRFINSYTMQTLIRPDLIPGAILALQTLAFRQDWLYAYDVLSAHPNNFADALRAYRSGTEEEFKELLPELPEFPDELSKFLRSDRIKQLADLPDLDPYISSLGAAGVPSGQSASQRTVLSGRTGQPSSSTARPNPPGRFRQAIHPQPPDEHSNLYDPFMPVMG